MHSSISVDEARRELRRRELERHMGFRFESYRKLVDVNQILSSTLTKISKCSKKQIVFEHNATSKREERERRIDFGWKTR